MPVILNEEGQIPCFEAERGRSQALNKATIARYGNSGSSANLAPIDVVHKCRIIADEICARRVTVDSSLLEEIIECFRDRVYIESDLDRVRSLLEICRVRKLIVLLVRVSAAHEERRLSECEGCGSADRNVGRAALTANRFAGDWRITKFRF